MVGDDLEEAPKNNMELETVEDQNTIKMDKDAANPFALKENTEKELVSTHIPEDSAPVEEKT